MNASDLEVARAVRELGAIRGLRWTPDESLAIARQLHDTQEALRAAAANVDMSAAEPAGDFSPRWDGAR